MGHDGPLDPRLKTLPVGRPERALQTHLARCAAESMPNRQCVALVKAAVGDFRSVREWRRGPNVLSRRLPPGTPIATFLDREGVDSPFYDGAVGVGAPGNMTSHAALLIDYVEGRDGKPDAILVFDQHALLDDFRRMIYPADDRLFGTANARNYFAILDADAQPIGGPSNPFWNAVQRAGAL
ncbi:MAG: hypothetical protein AcusKO_48490 [Acuticoccus sp.]